MAPRLATLSYQLTYVHKNTDALAKAVKGQKVQLLHNEIARRADGRGGYEHLPIIVGEWVTVASVVNQGFNGVKIFAHLNGGWVLEVDITNCASVIDTAVI